MRLSLLHEAKMGTVEPIYKPDEEVEEGSYGDSMAFLRGFVAKYKDANLDHEEIFDYLDHFTSK